MHFPGKFPAAFPHSLLAGGTSAVPEPGRVSGEGSVPSRPSPPHRSPLCCLPGQLRRRQSAAEPPEQGQVLSRGSSFTYQDVLDELIVYTRSDAAAQTDEFGFSLTDGLYMQAGRLEFSMELPRKQPPTVAVNRDLQLPAGTGTGQEWHCLVLLGGPA